ncbi:MAG: CotH kinase family protein [Bacteroidales bacterium]|nr:CotH kinase family protein [Bacteroidales bacterium]
MKKNVFISAMAAIACIGFSFSCTPSYPEVEETVSQKMSATIESGDASAVWATSDQLGVYTDKSEKNVKYANTASRSASQAVFKASSEVSGNPQYAYYPYSSANASRNATGLAGTVPQEQVMTTAGVYPYDYRYGVQTGTDSDENALFEFRSVLANVNVNVNAEGTALSGKELGNVICKVTRDGTELPVAGAFTFSAADGAYAHGSPVYSEVTASWNTAKTLGSATECHMTLFPVIRAGDVLEFTVNTADAAAKMSVTAEEDFAPEGWYTFQLALSEAEITVPEVPVVAPTINSMKFTVADNPGKILGRKFTHNSSFSATVSNVTEAVCTIDESSRTISLYLPYFNNRTLVPVFELSEGATLSSNGAEVISGKTAVDFATYKELTVTNVEGTEAVYTVNFTNTGLPVVVVNQVTGVTSSESSSKYSKASAAWYKATGTKWQPKDADWGMTEGADDFMVYNADGTSALTDKNGAAVSKPVLSSTRVRGNVTQQMPKKPFAVKLDKKHGMLGMPAHKRWVLLANWKDRTLMRNAVAFGIADVFQNTLSGGMEWNPSGQFVELVYNGVHVGTYYLCEQIKIDGNRLDINEPLDEEDNPYTGDPEVFGYLMESDDGYDEAWQFTTANYVPFLLKDDANADMLTYAQNFVRGIEDQLYNGSYSAAYEKMDLASFVDFWLIQELMMNSETSHPKSCYSYINNGKMYAGPLWDFDWNTLPVSSSYSENGYSFSKSMLEDAVASTGWFSSYKCYHKKSGYPSAPNNEGDKTYLWYPMLVKDATFKALAAERWNAVKGAVQAYVDTQIPIMEAQIAASEAENNKMWPVDSGSSAWGSKRYSTYGIGGGFCGDEAKSFSGAVDAMQSTLSSRISGMSYVSDQKWPNVKYGTK